MQVLRDRHYGAALGVAPFFWLLVVLFWPAMPAPDWTWPAREPGRFLLVALVYPVLEELSFRGLLQPALQHWGWGRAQRAGISGANVVTALLFSASHLVWHDAAQAAAVFLPGLVFGYFRDRYGRLTPSIALHIFYNTGFALLFVHPPP